MSVQRVHPRDIRQAYLNLKNQEKVPAPKGELVNEISKIIGIKLNPRSIDDWTNDVYRTICNMRRDITDYFLYKRYGSIDPETIMKNEMQETPEFKEAKTKITETDRQPYSLNSNYYVDEKVRGIKNVLDNVKPWDLSKEQAEAAMINLENLNYLWDLCLESFAQDEGYVFLSSAFTRGAGYDIPTFYQILGNLEKFVRVRSKQNVNKIITYIALGGLSSTSLLEGTNIPKALEFQDAIPRLISNGPVYVKCPLCDREFIHESSLRTHLRVDHSAQP